MTEPTAIEKLKGALVMTIDYHDREMESLEQELEQAKHFAKLWKAEAKELRRLVDMRGKVLKDMIECHRYLMCDYSKMRESRRRLVTLARSYIAEHNLIVDVLDRWYDLPDGGNSDALTLERCVMDIICAIEGAE